EVGRPRGGPRVGVGRELGGPGARTLRVARADDHLMTGHRPALGQACAFLPGASKYAYEHRSPRSGRAAGAAVPRWQERRVVDGGKPATTGKDPGRGRGGGGGGRSRRAASQARG